MPRWVQPVEPAGPVVTCLQRTLYLHWNGVHLQNLRPVPCGSQQSDDALVDDTGPAIRLALINVRSLRNKTFILNEFIRARNLDFLFITETWLNAGDVSVFGEVAPSNFAVFNTPRETGRGWCGLYF